MSLQVKRVGKHLVVTLSVPSIGEWPDNTVSGSNEFYSEKSKKHTYLRSFCG